MLGGFTTTEGASRWDVSMFLKVKHNYLIHMYRRFQIRYWIGAFWRLTETVIER